MTYKFNTLIKNEKKYVNMLIKSKIQEMLKENRIKANKEVIAETGMLEMLFKFYTASVIILSWKE